MRGHFMRGHYTTIWLSVLSRNQKLTHANKLTFLIILKKEQFT